MAHILLHGTLHVTIYEVDRLHSEGGGPHIFRKVYNLDDLFGGRKKNNNRYFYL